MTQNIFTIDGKEYSDEDTGHHDIKHKGKCSSVHPDMDHEEWEMSQNESLEIDEGKIAEIDARRKEGETPEQIARGMKVNVKNVKKVLGIREKIIDRPSVLDKKHTVKTKSGTKERVSRDDLEAAGDLYDRLMKKKEKIESVDYELSDLTKETLGRFIENSLFSDDIQELSKTTLGSYVRGAAKDIDQRAVSVGRNVQARNLSPAVKRQVRKVTKRHRGISKAVRKLAAQRDET